MNIFIPEKDAAACAEALDDKRLIKQILECAQLLATAQHIALQNAKNTQFSPTIPYKPTHINHPITQWVAKSRKNYIWTVEYMLACGQEYTYRFGKTHKCIGEYTKAAWYGGFYIPDTDGTPFINCTIFKDCTDIHTAYKAALILKWDNDKFPPKWTKRSRPNYG